MKARSPNHYTTREFPVWPPLENNSLPSKELQTKAHLVFLQKRQKWNKVEVTLQQGLYFFLCSCQTGAVSNKNSTRATSPWPLPPWLKTGACPWQACKATAVFPLTSTLYFLRALETLMARWVTIKKLAAPVRITKPYSLERTAILTCGRKNTSGGCLAPWARCRRRSQECDALLPARVSLQIENRCEWSEGSKR